VALHAVAEHVLAPARHAATDRIGLRVAPGGFATPPFPVEGGDRTLAVIGAELVVTDGAVERRAPLTTLRELGEVAGVTPGASPEVYPPATPLDLDAPLDVDPAAAAVLADWFGLVDGALTQLRDDLHDREPSEIQLWPEHFDDAFDAARINFGGSPGDADHVEPYLYVGPWDPRPGAFWNEPFGASRPWSEITTVDEALTFLRAGAVEP
jgi:hypothetical protein